MRFLINVWGDIKKGENLDLYVTVLAALILVTLSVLGVNVLQSQIPALILAVLALLTVSILGNRHRLEAILQKTSQERTGIFVEKFSDEIQGEINKKIERSKDLLIIGVALGRTLSLHYHALETKLRNGDPIRVVLVNPDCAGYQFTAYRHYRPISSESEHAQIMSSLESLCELRETTKGNLFIKVIDYPLNHGGIFVDSNTPDGALFLWLYGFKTRIKPKIFLYPTDKQWYSFFSGEAESVWNNAKPWNFKKVKNK